MSGGRFGLGLAVALLAEGATAATCHPVATSPQGLEAAEVEQVIAQAADVARQLNAPATIAVVDRVGNVLGVYAQSGAAATVRVGSGSPASGGLEGAVVPATLAAVSKALTGAYLSSSGQAFSTRTASFIVQDHFPPTIGNVPAGPLFGVQFSQLPCGDLVLAGEGMGIGPRRSPLGLSADPGGFPLYKQGAVVGGVGVIAGADPRYGLDAFPFDTDADLEEIIAHSATRGFDAPACIRAERVTAGGLSLRYSDADGRLRSSAARQAQGGAYVSVPGFVAAAQSPRAGRRVGDAASGIAPIRADRAGAGWQLVVDTGAARYPAANGDGLGAVEVQALLDEALAVAFAARSQIRQPLGAFAQVTVSVVDQEGALLGLVRTPDAPVFGVDVALQKARTAAFFSRRDAATRLRALLSTDAFAAYVRGDERAAAAVLQQPTVFADGRAFTPRAIGNLARPHFPDGIDARPRGPLSTGKPSWSPFAPGLSLDLVAGGLLAALDPTAVASGRCTGMAAGLDNGMQIFPGGVPVYRHGQLVGAVGVSGDGVDQDDMVAFLAISRAGRRLGNGLGQAPLGRRSDALGLRYIQCPPSPFLDSEAQNVCTVEDFPTVEAHAASDAETPSFGLPMLRVPDGSTRIDGGVLGPSATRAMPACAPVGARRCRRPREVQP